jgi:hypothetical protein
MITRYAKTFLLLASSLASPFVMADPLSEMTSPVSNPVNFEDPRALTELRAVYIFHKISNDFVTNGGDARIYALQARYAINDRFSLIATKDGYVDLNSDNPGLADSTGFGNLAGGAKYALFKNDDSILTLGATIETPTGDKEVFQGRGTFIRPFLTAGKAFDGLNLMSAIGLRTPLESKDDMLMDYDLHVDTPICSEFNPGIDINLIHVVNSGNRLPISDFGADYFNFGAANSDGKTMVTAAVTNRAKLSDNLNWGLAYQFPLTSGAGSNLFDWRITTDLQVSF